MSTFLVRQQVTYSLETTIEVADKLDLLEYLHSYDLEEQFEEEDVAATIDYSVDETPEIIETDQKPLWKLRGGKLVRVKKKEVKEVKETP